MAKVDKVRSARFKLGRSHPYLSTALWAFQLIERDMSEFEIHMFEDSEGESVRVSGPVADPAAFMEENELVYKGSVVREFAVDERWRIYYDPKGVERYEVDELAFIMLHEVHHLIRNHADRARSKQVVPDVWNIAGDMEINDDLDAEGTYKLPDGAMLPGLIQAPDGLLAEEYYDLLTQMSDSKQPKGDGVGKGMCGSCATGDREDYEAPTDGGGESGGGGRDGEDPDNPPGISPAEGKYLKRKIAKDIQSHEKTHGIGSVPNNYLRWAELELEPPQVAWERLLGGAVRRSWEYVRGAVDYTYSRPSRRAAVFPDIIYPSMHKPVPKVAVVADTSASMGTEEGRAVMAETDGILKNCGASRIRVLSCDADVHTDRWVASLSEVKLEGGGGTDMGRALEVLDERRADRPHIAIVLTDGFTPWPTRRPDFEVIVCVINGTTEGIPSWAKWVQIGTNHDETTESDCGW